MNHHRRHDCRLCGSKNLKAVLHLAPTPLADLYLDEEHKHQSCPCFPLDLYFCENCYHVQLSDVIDPRDLFENYIYETTSSPGLVDHFQNYVEDTIQKMNNPPGSKVLDIGSNDGTLLKIFKHFGYQVLGVDAAKEIAKKTTQNGIETIAGFFDSQLARQIQKQKGTMDIITANNVYAHADNLPDITDGVRLLLNPDGVFIFEVSNLFDLIQNKVFDFIYHEHLCYHSVLSLDRFFKRHGLVLFDAKPIPTKGGSIRGYVKLESSNRTVSDTVLNLINQEMALGLDKAQTYLKFESEIVQIKEQAMRLIRQIKKDNKTIGAYGASATTTTLIYHFELTQDLSFIVDDNKDRQGLFSPGCHLPVISSEEMYAKKPDYILIAAWRFSDAIIKKHEAFLKQGGHFIIPLPKLKIV
ncbi:MAG: class I SAM-dependent methyltransferase [Pseudomonadota bacterium]